MLVWTDLNNAAPRESRPRCMLCDKPLKAKLRDAWVRVRAGEDIDEVELFRRATRKLEDLLRTPVAELPRLWFVKFDRAAVVPRDIDNTYRVTIWVEGHYTGFIYTAAREQPCFCNQRCAIEFSRVAVESGFAMRQETEAA